MTSAVAVETHEISAAVNYTPLSTTVLNVLLFLVIHTKQIFKTIPLKALSIHFLTNAQEKPPEGRKHPTNNQETSRF
jgi:hypothetical protein